MFSRRKQILIVQNKKKFRGQTVLETLFVFTAMIFLAFAMLNLNTSLFTRYIANYAAFMAARSYQVYGDHRDLNGIDNDIVPKEVKDGGGVQNILEDEKALSMVRTAEDIMTCALPWYSVPENDRDDNNQNQLIDEKDPYYDCYEGRRKYEDTNINRQVSVFRFDDSQSPQLAASQSGSLLEGVAQSFREQGREPLRYAILKLQYKNKLVFNVLKVFDGTVQVKEAGGQIVAKELNDSNRDRYWFDVHVPLLLNPGLNSGVRIAEEGEVDTNVDETVKEDPSLNQGSNNNQNQASN